MKPSVEFKPVDKATHIERLQKIANRSNKKYIDDGPTALYLVIKNMRSQGFNDVVEWALLELERLYSLEDSIKVNK